MKKLGIAILTIGLMLGAAACGKKAPQGPNVEGTPQEQSGKGRFIAQDYTSRIDSIAGMTEKGIYLGTEHTLKYYDFALQKEIYLCNKPECKHDGNQYCVATNSKYRYETINMYSNELLISAVEETDTQYVFHILVAALDGSELEDYMTFAKVEKASFETAYIRTTAYHRNYAVIGIGLMGTGGLEDTNCYATYLINLDTKEVTCLDEEAFGKESTNTMNASADGDYFYYVRVMRGKGQRRKLCRYSIHGGKEEEFEFSLIFSGQYYIAGNKILYLLSSGSDLMIYDLTDGKEQRVGVSTKDVYEMEHVNYDSSMGITKSLSLNYRGIVTDKQYIYIITGTDLMYYYNDNIETEIYTGYHI